MKYSLLFCTFLLALTSSFLLALPPTLIRQSLKPSQERCCVSCELPKLKYYSLANKRCGECCIDPRDYFKYKIFQPHLAKADTNTPCNDRSFSYNETETHKAGSIQVQVDLFIHKSQ